MEARFKAGFLYARNANASAPIRRINCQRRPHPRHPPHLLVTVVKNHLFAVFRHPPSYGYTHNIKEKRGTKGMLRNIIESVIKESTTEQLDETFDELARVISLRSAQGMGTDQSLSEMLAAVAAERNTREPVAK